MGLITHKICDQHKNLRKNVMDLDKHFYCTHGNATYSFAKKKGVVEYIVVELPSAKKSKINCKNWF